MLIIPRGKDESIVIGDHVIITVEEITEDEIRFRIEYPEDVSVCRGETLVAAELEPSQ